MFDIKAVVYSLSITGAFVCDSIFSISRFPVIFMVVCGIVVVYEFVSPFIYSSR